MRSIRLMAATTVIVALAWACGDNGGGVGPNDPVAIFSQTCTDLTCTFADASTPAGQLTWAWDFGDPASGTANNTATVQNPTHTFSAAGPYNVKLTVTNSSGAIDDQTNAVTVTAPANPAPTASFSVPSCGVRVNCSFTSTSSDVAPGTITATHWNFGETGSPTNEADGITVGHTYNAAGDYQVTLTVTDDGGAIGTTTQAVHVRAAPASDCPSTGTTVNCALNIAQPGGVKLTLTGVSCELSGNRVNVVWPEPNAQVAFANVCNRVPPADYTVTADGTATGAPATFPAGQVLHITFRQGTADQAGGDPAPGSAVARVEGTSPNWTITIDDGGNPDGQNEPDFNDVIVQVRAGQ
jgi:PKD repeat protein